MTSPRPLAMFFWCCGPRQRARGDDEEQQRTTQVRLALFSLRRGTTELTAHTSSCRTYHQRRLIGCWVATHLQRACRSHRATLWRTDSFPRHPALALPVIESSNCRYLENGSDAESSEEEEFIHDVLREAEGYVPPCIYLFFVLCLLARSPLVHPTRADLSLHSSSIVVLPHICALLLHFLIPRKMINVTHDDPLQFHSSTTHYYLSNNLQSPDAASDGSHDRAYYGGRRGRRTDRRKRRKTRPSGETTSKVNGNGTPHESGSRSRSSSQSRSRSRDSAYDDDYDDDGYRHARAPYYDEYPYTNNDDPSQSLSPSHSHSPDVDDEEEEARLRRLRGPKLSARILPLPARQIELDEEEERIRAEEAMFSGQGNGDGELTPVQERRGIDLVASGPGKGMNGRGKGVMVEPLNEEDEQTVRSCCVMLSSHPSHFLVMVCFLLSSFLLLRLLRCF